MERAVFLYVVDCANHLRRWKKKKKKTTNETNRLLSLRQTFNTTGAGTLTILLACTDAASSYGASIPACVLDHHWTGVSLD